MKLLLIILLSLSSSFCLADEAMSKAQESFWATSWGQDLKRTQKQIENKAIGIMREQGLEEPMAYILYGTKIAIDKKVQFETKNPLISSQKLQLVIKPDDIHFKVQGKEFIFPKSQYYLQTSTTGIGAGFSIDF